MIGPASEARAFCFWDGDDECGGAEIVVGGGRGSIARSLPLFLFGRVAAGEEEEEPDIFIFVAVGVGAVEEGAGAGLGGLAYNSVHCLAVLSCCVRLRTNSVAMLGTVDVSLVASG